MPDITPLLSANAVFDGQPKKTLKCVPFFSYPVPKQIDEGTKRLVATIEEALWK
jgi:hypothetical protein